MPPSEPPQDTATVAAKSATAKPLSRKRRILTRYGDDGLTWNKVR